MDHIPSNRPRIHRKTTATHKLDIAISSIQSTKMRLNRIYGSISWWAMMAIVSSIGPIRHRHVHHGACAWTTNRLSNRLKLPFHNINLVSQSRTTAEMVVLSASLTTTTTAVCTKDVTGLQSSTRSSDHEEDGGTADGADCNDADKLRMQNAKLFRLFRTLPALATVETSDDDDEGSEKNCPVRFDTPKEDHVRGIYVNRSFKKDETVLRIPLNPVGYWCGCLVDRRSSTWLPQHVQDDPSKWATRLAASWLDLFLQNQQSNEVDRKDSFAQWFGLLPKQEELRSSLPVHWSDETLRKAKCTTLELAVDSAFFVRGEAMADLMEGLQKSPFISNGDSLIKDHHYEKFEKLCEYALDLVQTRACRLEPSAAMSGNKDDDKDYCQSDDHIEADQIRVMAPIFDFINHGGPNAANAYFELQEAQHEVSLPHDALVVKASRDIARDDQLLIDYGAASTSPSWKCLFSYGFVPHHDQSSFNDEAEVYVSGVRYEVSAETIPVELVLNARPTEELSFEQEDLAENISSKNLELSPELATRLANRITVAAYNLILDVDDDFDEDSDDDDPSLILAEELAARLRWSQHRVLLACADGLTSFAGQ